MLNYLDHTVYSFLDLSGIITHPDIGESFPLTGQGVGHIAITMNEDKTYQEISVHGDVIIGVIPGAESGKVEISCQQTSNMHKFLLHTYQTIKGSSDVKSWGRMVAYLKNICDGSEHHIKGLTFGRIPEKRYSAQGDMVLWSLNAADIISLAPNPSEAGASILGRLRKNFTPQF